MTTLQEWLGRLKKYDPDDWGNLDELRTSFAQEELDTDLEAEIVFRTHIGQVDRVSILLLDPDDNVVVDLGYSPSQIDMVVLTEFLRDAVFPGEADSDSASL